MRVGASLFLIALGAMLKFAVSATVSGIDLTMIGLILMIIGGFGLIISLILLSSRRRCDVITRSDVLGDVAETRTTHIGRSRIDSEL